MGCEATTALVKDRLPKSRIAHLATHGIFDEVAPKVRSHLQGAIVLAKSSDLDDGLLWPSEVQGMQLAGTEMVVLSACNTGRGKITADGVAGLSRAFVVAGVPSVVVSLWPVSDEWTCSLMIMFYENLVQKRMDKAKALREAMLEVMKQRRYTFQNWAPFNLIGEPRIKDQYKYTMYYRAWFAFVGASCAPWHHWNTIEKIALNVSHAAEIVM